MPFHWLQALALYLPSLLSRYSTQVLVIAIPWLLQAQGVGLADISAALLPFYAGSFLFSAIASVRPPTWNLPLTLVAVLALQGLFSLLCLLSMSMAWLAVFRFLQGAATGLSRPLAQLWALERDTSAQASAGKKMQVNVFVQVAIALGMALGSHVGVMLGRERGGLGFLVLAVLIPVVIACASVWMLARRPAVDVLAPFMPQEAAPHNPTEVPPASAGGLRGLKPGLAGAFLVFLASMAAYNVWPVLVPYTVRSRGLTELSAVLALVLALQPLLFGLAQLVAAAALKRIFAGDRMLLGLLLGSHVVSLLLLRVAALQDEPWIFGLSFLMAAGLVVAAIYPLSSLLLMRHVEHLPAGERRASQRRLILLFGLAGDLGQLLGGGLLVCGIFPGQPLDLLWLTVLLALPAVLGLGGQPQRERS